MGIIVPFPTDIPLVLAISDPVLENFLDYHGIVFRHLSVRSVVVQHNFAAIHMWKIQLEAVGMNLHQALLDMSNKTGWNTTKSIMYR